MNTKPESTYLHFLILADKRDLATQRLGASWTPPVWYRFLRLNRKGAEASYFA